jgi:hypothetical protein
LLQQNKAPTAKPYDYNTAAFGRVEPLLLGIDYRMQLKLASK